MLLSTQFPELFREETYAVNLMLMDNAMVGNVFDGIVATKPISGIWTKEYSVVPIGELDGRSEAEPIRQHNMAMGYTAFGAQSIEASGMVNISNVMQQRSREFQSPEGAINEPSFAGHLADTVSRGFLMRRGQKWHRLAANLFNLGGIQAGNAFFNQRTRANGLSDVPNSNLIYDGSPLFALPANAHPSFAAGALIGRDAAAVGTSIDMAATIADTGGYFNAFQLAPSYWALKRVYTHWVNNMQYDENDEQFDRSPDTLLISSHNTMKWMEILESRFIEPTAAGNTTNIENVFQMDDVRVRVVSSNRLVKNTWFLGKAMAGGIKILTPEETEDPWAYWREESNRAYFISYEDNWGFLVRNWRDWCAGSFATDGTTVPTFNNVTEENWHLIPAGV